MTLPVIVRIILVAVKPICNTQLRISGKPHAPILDIPFGPRIVQNTIMMIPKAMEAQDHTVVDFFAPKRATKTPPVNAHTRPTTIVTLPIICAAW